MIKKIAELLFIYILLGSSILLASKEKLRFSGSKMTSNKTNGTVLLIGKAEVSEGNNKIVADQILFDQKNNILTANGNCGYQKSDSIVKSGRMVFDISEGNWVRRE